MSITSTTTQTTSPLATTSPATTSSTATSSAGSSSQTNDALSALSSNMNNFLSLLMTQLQNQDPTSPLDANSFTTELVQFSGVEQQIQTNTSLTQLIQLTQAGEMMQSSAMVGKQVSVTSDHIPLQNGSGALQFTESSAQPVIVSVYNDSGALIRQDTVNATAGQNTWNWDGTDSSGNSVPDGSYKVAVMAADASGTATAVPFTVLGTATGVQKQDNSMQLQLGALGVDFGAVQSVNQ
jgi:flagellar basal-body rod modification protein FlgD